MALKSTIKNMHQLLEEITIDLHKAEGGNKAASQRVRTGTITLEKVAKQYRKESIANEKTEMKTGASKRKTAKKAPAKKSVKAKAKPKSATAKKKMTVKKKTAKSTTRRSARA